MIDRNIVLLKSVFRVNWSTVFCYIVLSPTFATESVFVGSTPRPKIYGLEQVDTHCWTDGTKVRISVIEGRKACWRVLLLACPPTTQFMNKPLSFVKVRLPVKQRGLLAKTVIYFTVNGFFEFFTQTLLHPVL